jgi:hypothetical protein
LFKETLLRFFRDVEAYAGIDVRLHVASHLGKTEESLLEVMDKAEGNFTATSETEYAILLSSYQTQASAILNAAAQITDADAGLDVGHALQKAFSQADWANIKRGHNEEGIASVDHSFHMKKPDDGLAMPKVEATHSGWEDIANSPGVKRQNHDLDDNGASPKMIHGTKHGTYMTKPYHQARDDEGDYNPHDVRGWATMATKALYDDTGLGHMIEDVHTNEHKGIPVTVHKFAEGFEPIGDADSYKKTNINDVRKIGLLDFLTANSDRHTNNLMIGPYGDEDTSTSPLLAIDHERSFQYHGDPFGRYDHTTKKSRTAPVDYFGTGLDEAKNLSPTDEGWHDLVDYWKQKGPIARKTVQNHAEAIKDPELKQHILKNFNERADYLDRWVNDQHLDHKGNPIGASTHDLFDPQMPDVVQHKFPERRSGTAEEILRRVAPKDHVDAFKTLIQHAHNSQHTKTTKRGFMEAIKGIVDQASPEDLAHMAELSHTGQLSSKVRIDRKTPWKYIVDHLRHEAKRGNLKSEHAKKVLATMGADKRFHGGLKQELSNIVGGSK